MQLLLWRQLIEDALCVQPAQLLVREIQRRLPIRRGKSVRTGAEIDAQPVRRSQQLIYRLRRQIGFLERVSVGKLIVQPVQGNKWPRRHQRDQPMLVEWQLIDLPRKLRQPRTNPIRKVRDDLVQSLLAAVVVPLKRNAPVP